MKGGGKECGKKNKHHWIIRQKWLAGRARNLKTLGSKARKAKESIRATSSLYTCSARTNTIGPIIMSYVSSRPSTLSYCGDDDSLGPCLGPQCDRWKRRENYLPDWLCKCDGNGFCFNSLDVGPLLTRHCTCVRICLDFPVSTWRENAWNVVKVLKLSPAAQLRRPQRNVM